MMTVPSDAESGSEPATANALPQASSQQAERLRSLSSSVRNYTFENGRRFHKFREGRYNYPNDEPEQEREDMKHAMVVHLCQGKLHFAPLDSPHMVLDVGTGTGIWAMDMADEYAGAEVVGVDLSPIQPRWVPPNVRFVVDDAEDAWVYGDGVFDLVHARHMGGSIKDWPKLLSQAYRALKPGGWLEMQEMHWVYGCDDGTMPADYGPKIMSETIARALAAMGLELHVAALMPARVADAGFVRAEQRVHKVPVGPWPRDETMRMVGTYNHSVVWDGLQAITTATLTRGLGWTSNQVELFLVKVRRDLMDSAVHSYVTLHSLWAQKPGADELADPPRC